MQKNVQAPLKASAAHAIKSLPKNLNFSPLSRFSFLTPPPLFRHKGELYRADNLF